MIGAWAGSAGRQTGIPPLGALVSLSRHSSRRRIRPAFFPWERRRIRPALDTAGSAGHQTGISPLGALVVRPALDTAGSAGQPVTP
jgi:hypothetical protein